MPDPEGMLMCTDYTCLFAKAERDRGCCGCSMRGSEETSD